MDFTEAELEAIVMALARGRSPRSFTEEEVIEVARQLMEWRFWGTMLSLVLAEKAVLDLRDGKVTIGFRPTDEASSASSSHAHAAHGPAFEQASTDER